MSSVERLKIIRAVVQEQRAALADTDGDDTKFDSWLLRLERTIETELNRRLLMLADIIQEAHTPVTAKEHTVRERPKAGQDYLVAWAVSVKAESPEVAAMKALDAQQDGTMTTASFTVVNILTGDRYKIDVSAPEYDMWQKGYTPVPEAQPEAKDYRPGVARVLS